MTQITLNLDSVRQTIALAASTYSRRPDNIRLLAVSKRHSAAAVGEAAAHGQTHFGENFVSEGVEKMAQLPADLIWHFIGTIQSNKTRDIAKHYDWVHTVDRAKIARRLCEQRDQDAPLNVCVQINLGGGATRGGIEPAAALELAHIVNERPQLALRGLMLLPPPETDIDAQRHHFRRLARLAARGIDEGLPLHELSMGMSGDLTAAIAEGATWVRIGTAIFGTRPAASR